jgi:hypothetical protein
LIATGSNLNQHPIYAVKEMEGKQIIGVWENLRRQKTGHQYYTFSSPESTTAINHYLLTREHLNSLDLPLFNISGKRLSDLFKETNDRLGLGKNGEFSRFATHMLRRYHSTQLAEAGMEEGKIDMLQGRKPRTVLYQSYLKIKTSTLKEDYIRALPYLIIEDVERYKTELELVREENQEYKNQLSEFRKDLNDLKKRSILWEEMKQ